MAEPAFCADHAGATVRPSPNIGVRADGTTIDLLVLHYTEMESGKGAEDWLCNPESQVSCHYVLHEDGAVVQLVAERDRAWHAGKGSWQGREDVNSRSVGIEIVNGGHRYGLPPYPDAQIEALIALCRGILARHAIAPWNIVAHSDIAPERKRDPGEHFPWARLAASGIGLWAEASGPAGTQVLREGDTGPGVAALQEKLVQYGMECPISGVFDRRTSICVEAFQRRFRQVLVDGAADRSTLQVLDDILALTAKARNAPTRVP